MKTKVLKEVENFFHAHLKSQDPFLLALSGGPDSLFLFYFLLEKQIPFHVAHVNHGWRKASDEEENHLEKLCKKEGISFHVKRLCLSQDSKDIENLSRKLRLDFFKELYIKFNFQAVLLGHHADDLAETVLKRVFEGASLHRLKGFSEVTLFEGVPLWRPLRRLHKKEIISFLQERKIPYFLDPTNLDPKFLRSRLRGSLLPQLSKEFGKEVVPSLLRLSKAAEELEVFVNEIIKEYSPQTSLSTCDFSQKKPKTDFEWKVLLRDFFNQQGMAPSLFTLDTLIIHLKRKKAKKDIKIGPEWVRIEDGKLILER